MLISELLEVMSHELHSGFYKGRKAIEDTKQFLNGQIAVEVNGHAYKAVRRLTGKDLEKGMLVAASYNSTNQGVDFVKILGVTDNKQKYGDSGVVFDSVKAALQHENVSSIAQLEALKHDKEYGQDHRLVVEDLESGESGPWYYLSSGRWARGSGAEKLSFVEIKIVSTKEAELSEGLSRSENKFMQDFLAKHGIHCNVKYLVVGSMKGTWRFHGKNQQWTPELIHSLTELGFVHFDKEPLNKHSGNGGAFAVFVRAKPNTPASMAVSLALLPPTNTAKP